MSEFAKTLRGLMLAINLSCLGSIHAVTEEGDLERPGSATPPEQRFTSHFVTCPNARQHRQR